MRSVSLSSLWVTSGWFRWTPCSRRNKYWCKTLSQHKLTAPSSHYLSGGVAVTLNSIIIDNSIGKKHFLTVFGLSIIYILWKLLFILADGNTPFNPCVCLCLCACVCVRLHGCHRPCAAWSWSVRSWPVRRPRCRGTTLWWVQSLSLRCSLHVDWLRLSTPPRGQNASSFISM